VVELDFQFLVPIFSEERAPLCELFHLRIIIDVEVLGFQHVPFKFRVLNFVTAEVEELREAWRRCQQRYEQ